MGQSLCQVYVHLIFSTQDREPLLVGALRGHAYLAAVLNNHGSAAVKVGGPSDEYRRFLKRYGVEYDERYVWD